MIPKIIHYCWFGKNSKPEIVERCIASWKKYCPDWEIKEWNEDNFDVTSIPYMKEAYEAKKWAFVSDVARLLILYQLGGVYLDTDVEVLCENPFERYLQYESILAFENERNIASGLIYGGIQGAQLSKELLEPYLRTHYLVETEMVNSKMNYPVFKRKFPALKWDGRTQIQNNTIIIGCLDYASCMMHHGTRTWCDNLPEYQVSKSNKMKRILRNPEIFQKMEKHTILRKIIPVYEFFAYDFLDLGPIYFIKRQLLKLRNKRK